MFSWSGNDSGWQSSRTYTDTGLTPGETYSYAVRARDTSSANNVTVPSAAFLRQLVQLIMTAPSPDPMQLSEVNSSSSITLTATTATDDSAVEYYFTSLSDGAADSGWQSSPDIH